MEDMVVTLSGVIGVGELSGKTADQLIDLALTNWKIPRDSIEGPFVTLHNRASNKFRSIQGSETVGGIDPEKDLIRVVLPLKTCNIEQGDPKQYLVE